MNSHKQLPRCVLKNFCVSGRLFCYDVLNKTFSSSTVNEFNTEEDYYSEKMEKQLSKDIEQPLGELISFLEKKIYSPEGSIKVKKKHLQSVYNYVYALFARSQNMHEKVYNAFIFRDFFHYSVFMILRLRTHLI